MNGELYTRTHCHKPSRSGDQHGNATLAALAGVAVGVILVLLTWLLVLMTKDDPAKQSVSTPSSAPAPPVSVTTRTVAPPAVKGTSSSAPAVPKAIGDVRSLPAGLFCRDLKAKGYSYVAAIEYWRLHGQPNQMDADRNGIPCETVYPRSDVASYWNGREVNGVVPWTAGLFCRDLVARGATYGQAVQYWWYYGMPARMDADTNGIPCETVYSATTVNAFWYP